MGDGVHGVRCAGDVIGAARLDAADGVCLLLAEPEGNQNTEAMGKSEPVLPEPGVWGRAAGGWAGSSWPTDTVGENRGGLHSPGVPWRSPGARPANRIRTRMPEMAPFLSALAGQKRRFAIRQLYELGSSFYIKTHSFIHSLNKDVLSVCWLPDAGDIKGILPHGPLGWAGCTGHK